MKRILSLILALLLCLSFAGPYAFADSDSSETEAEDFLGEPIPEEPTTEETPVLEEELPAPEEFPSPEDQMDPDGSEDPEDIKPEDEIVNASDAEIPPQDAEPETPSSEEDPPAPEEPDIPGETTAPEESPAPEETSKPEETPVPIAAPVLKEAKNVKDGVTVTWYPSAGAELYRVFRQKTNGGWIILGDTTETSFTDTTARSGSTCTYTVRCVSSDGTLYASAYDKQGISVFYIAAPVLRTAKSTENGVTITWKDSDGAELYRVFRQKTNGGWTILGDTTGTSFTDTTARSGSICTYTVRCMTADGAAYTSAYDSQGISVSYIAAPVLKSAKNAENGVTVTWKASAGADFYRVFRLREDGGWKTVGTTSDTSFTDTAVTSGVEYTYTVRCISADQTSYISAYDTSGVVVSYIAAPVPTAQNAEEGITVTWKACAGAELYRVFRLRDDGGWKTVTTTSETSFTDTAVTSGVEYTYTVRCISADQTSFTSAYNLTGTTLTRLSSPTLLGAYLNKNGATVTWSRIPGADSYHIYRKSPGNSWEMICVVPDGENLSFTDTTATDSSTLYYTVRAVCGTDLSWYKAGIRLVPGTAYKMTQKAQNYSSATSYLLLVDTSACKTGVFRGSYRNWTLVYFWDCSPGAYSSPTVLGTFTVGAKGYSFGGSSYRCYYYTQFYGNYLFHSVLYNLNGTVQDGRLGMHLSHGCVRLAIGNAKWIYDNVPVGTKVVTY